MKRGSGHTVNVGAGLRVEVEGDREASLLGRLGVLERRCCVATDRSAATLRVLRAGQTHRSFLFG